MVSASTLSVGDRNTDGKKSSGRGDRPACRYVTIPPEHVSRCDQGDVADDNGVSSVSRWGRHQTFARLTMLVSRADGSFIGFFAWRSNFVAKSSWSRAKAGALLYVRVFRR